MAAAAAAAAPWPQRGRDEREPADPIVQALTSCPARLLDLAMAHSDDLGTRCYRIDGVQCTRGTCLPTTGGGGGRVKSSVVRLYPGGARALARPDERLPTRSISGGSCCCCWCCVDTDGRWVAVARATRATHHTAGEGGQSTRPR